MTPEKKRGENCGKERASDPDYTTRNPGEKTAGGLTISLTAQPKTGPTNKLRKEAVTS